MQEGYDEYEERSIGKVYKKIWGCKGKIIESQKKTGR